MPRAAEPLIIRAELVATVAALEVAEGDRVAAGDSVVLLESMKMEIPVLTEIAGTVAELRCAPGDNVQEGDALVVVAP